MEDIIILGSGCAGLTAAIYTARANLNPLIIEGLQPGGQLTTTSEVENFPGFPEGIDGFELMNRMRNQAKRFNVRFINDVINDVKIDNNLKILISKNHIYSAKSIIIATGASPKMLNVPGEKELFGGKGVTTCATCDGAFYKNMEVIVVGGGDSACEEALFLTRFCKQVTLIHRRDQLKASKIMANRVMKHDKIKIIWNSKIEKILGTEIQSVSGVMLHNLKNGKKEILSCKGVFLAIGNIPNTNAFNKILQLDSNGYIVTKQNSMIETSINGVYACGDCVDFKFRQAITSAGMGCQAAIEAEAYLSHINDLS